MCFTDMYIYYDFTVLEVKKAMYSQVSECQEMKKFSQLMASCIMTVHIPTQHFW
jgi:hypothetical protein